MFDVKWIIVHLYFLKWMAHCGFLKSVSSLLGFNYLAPHRGRARYCNAHVCLFVCVFVCVFVCLFVCLFVRVFAKFQSVISQPFLNRSL